MSAGFILAIVLAFMALLLIIGCPIGFSILISTTLGVFIQDLPSSMATLRMIARADSFLLTAIPFFIFAGVLMREGGITKRILNFSVVLLGHLPGALGHVNIFASMVSILIPEMIEKKYPRSVSAAITATSSTIGIIIPPSIPMILYAMASETSIGRLFLGGAIPGILVGLIMMVITAYMSVKEGYGKERDNPPTFKEVVVGFKDGIFALTMPLIIIGSIVGGIVTATEASVLAVFCALILGFFVFKELKLKIFTPLLKKLFARQL
jgi:C4-dicarboxylate transporter DctM subunit